ncbi:general substrate transporter [Aspergillus cavernicola]|uniref:General substrate transporter n=1 Tax=Aspergillus cavernicola TaxID=176166 RepID=A0ABR4HFU4_9EURO
MMITNIYAITAIAVIGGSLFGFDLSSMSAILPTSQYRCYFNQGPNGPSLNGATHCSGPDPTVQGGITASMSGGSFIGALISGFVTDIFGRKSAIQMGSIIWIIGSILSCASQNIGMLILGRFLNGMCVGICSAQVPVYVGELAPHLRGLVMGAQQWAITWGILIMFFLSYGCSFLTGPVAFRLPWGLQIVPGIILFLGLLFTPESPRWLAKKDRWDECCHIITSVHANNHLDDGFIQMEIQQLKDACELERDKTDNTYLDLFRPHMIWRTHIIVFVQVWCQLTGINAILYYITYIFGMAGLSGSSNLVASSISSVINVVVTIPGLVFLDRIGRRPFLIGGSISLTIWWAVCAGLMGGYGNPAPPGGLNNIREQSWVITGAPAKVVIACSYLIVASFAPTWGPIEWVYPSELFPLRLRGKAAALSTASNWAVNFALSYFVPSAFVNINWKTYVIFAVFCFAMTLHVFFVFPETSGRTLEEVEDVFKGVKLAWKMGDNKLKDDEERTNDHELNRTKCDEALHIEDTSGSA